MGVISFWKLLDNEQIGADGHLDELHGKKVAVDISGWIVQSEQVQYGQRKINKPHIRVSQIKHTPPPKWCILAVVSRRNLFWRCYHLMQRHVKVVFIVDGEPPALKDNELQRRSKMRSKAKSNHVGYSVNKSGAGINSDSSQASTSRRPSGGFQVLVDECCQLLECLGLPWLRSPGEAEALCAWLNKNGYVDGIISDDSDCFLFGAETVYRNFTCDENKVSFAKYTASDIQEKLALSQRHMISLALLLGCDFGYEGVKNIGPEYALSWMKTLEQDDPLKRFDDWRTNSEHYEAIEIGRTQKKPVHCGQCLHIGGVVSHRSKGCEICMTGYGCQKANNINCHCDFHKKKVNYEKHAVELKVRREALKDDNFPNMEIVNIYTQAITEIKYLPVFTWKDPDYSALQLFLWRNLAWDEDSINNRLAVIASAHALKSDSSCEGDPLEPIRIIKCRRRHGKDLYEVEWKFTDGILTNSQDSNVKMTCVPQEQFRTKYKEIVQKFEMDQLEKKSSKQKSTRKDSKINQSQGTIDTFFPVKKVNRSLFSNIRDTCSKEVNHPQDHKEEQQVNQIQPESQKEQCQDCVKEKHTDINDKIPEETQKIQNVNKTCGDYNAVQVTTQQDCSELFILEGCKYIPYKDEKAQTDDTSQKDTKGRHVISNLQTGEVVAIIGEKSSNSTLKHKLAETMCQRVDDASSPSKLQKDTTSAFTTLP